MVGLAHEEGTIFEALWAPRWFGQDQAMARGQEGIFVFRGPVPPPEASFTMLAAGIEKPRYEARCRLLDLRHGQLGRLQAIVVEPGEYRFVGGDGDVVRVAPDGSLRQGEGAVAPPDWTVRCIFEVLP